MTDNTNTPPAGEYEFSNLENETIEKTANWSKYLAFSMFVTAAISVFNYNLVDSAVKIIVGYFFFDGSKSLKAVVDTEGSDVTNMMSALSKLNTAFNVRIWVTLISLVVVGVALLIVLMVVGAAASAK